MLGTAVVSGMLAATLLGVFIIPALFVFVERLGARKKKAEPREPAGAAAPQGVDSDRSPPQGGADPAHAE
jgi:hypothetical protein